MPLGSRPRVPAVAAAAIALVVVLAGCEDGGTEASSGNTHPSVTLGSEATAGGPSTVPPSVGSGTGATAATASTGTSGGGSTGTTGSAAGSTTTVTAGGGAPGGPGLPPAPPPTGPVTVGGAAAATNLASRPGCDPENLTRPLVRLTWQPSGGGEQVVAVSTRPDGFQTGVQAASEALPANRAEYELRDSQTGGVYYWRVLTRTGPGWAASASAQFEGPTCVRF